MTSPATPSPGPSTPPASSHQDWHGPEVHDLIVSFPKSGRTWLRVLMAAAIALHQKRDLSTLVATWLDSDLLDLDGRPLLFTHALSNRMECDLDAMRSFAAHVQSARRLLLLRDPRDTVISYYFQRTRRPRKDAPEPIPHELSALVRHPALGIDRIIDFINVWIESLASGGPAIIVHYEDLHAQPRACLQHSLSFFGIELKDGSMLDEAIAFATFSNMRRMETGEHYISSKKLRAYDRDDPQTFKTREGKVGGFREHLTASDIEYVESRIEGRLDPAAGYRQPGLPGASHTSRSQLSSGDGVSVHPCVDVAARGMTGGLHHARKHRP